MEFSVNPTDLANLNDATLGAAKRGLRKTAIELTNEVKKLLSTPAPRKRVQAKRGQLAGTYYYRATTPATPGDPPRKLTGRLRSSIAYEILNGGLRAVVGTNVQYAEYLEAKGHPFLSTVAATAGDTLERNISDEIS